VSGGLNFHWQLHHLRSEHASKLNSALLRKRQTDRLHRNESTTNGMCGKSLGSLSAQPTTSTTHSYDDSQSMIRSTPSVSMPVISDSVTLAEVGTRSAVNTYATNFACWRRHSPTWVKSAPVVTPAEKLTSGCLNSPPPINAKIPHRSECSLFHSKSYVTLRHWSNHWLMKPN